MNCILHTKVCPVHSPGAPPTSFFYLLPSINCTLASRYAYFQNGPCTATTEAGLKKKIIMQQNLEFRRTVPMSELI